MRGIHLPAVLADLRTVARGTSLRPLRTAPFRRSRVSASADELTARLEALVAERQELRSRGASGKALERNRLQIARTQWELAHVLIDGHLPPGAAATVA